MTKGMSSKISKSAGYLKDKTVSSVKITGNKITNISNKLGELKGEAKNIESTVKDNLNLAEKKDRTKSSLLEGINKIKNFDENISSKQSKSRIRDELLDGKSVVNKYGIVGPGTYKYLIYVILFLNTCSIILLTFNENTFYKYQNNIPLYLRLNNNVFYIYIFTLFLLILQLYTLKENYDAILERRGKYQVYIEIFNILCTIGLTYYIYKQVDFIHTECPEPNIKKCVANTIGNTNQISSCSKGPFQCGKINLKEYDCKKNDCDDDIAKNFYLIPEEPPPITDVITTSVTNLVSTSPTTTPATTPKTTDSTTPSPLGIPMETLREKFNEFIKTDEGRIKDLEDTIKNFSSGIGMTGPPGPPGEPGTPGNDSRPTPPPPNQFENILCPNEPGGICKDGQSRCNDKGMCEGFALISLQDKIDLKLKYKDLNNNAYKAENLMNNLENYLLNSLK